MMTDAPLIATFIAYLIIVISLGMVAYRATRNLSDYILGGRKLGPAVTALSVGASDMSGWLLMGLPGAVYLSGLNQIWLGIGLLIGAYLNWLFVAKRLREATEQANDSLTLPDYFEYRFNDPKGRIRVVAAFTILLFFTLYCASGLVAGAFLFEQVFGMSYQIALWSGAVVIVGYTFIGGFLAVSWTDFFQGCLMLVALLILPIAAAQNLQGGSLPEQLPTGFLDIGSGMTLVGTMSLLAWGLGYFGQPHILSRFMAIRSSNELATSRRIAMSWMIMSLAGAMMVGLYGAALFSNSQLTNPETIFIALSRALLNPWLAGILIAGILSAVMSTIDSQLLVCSSVVAEDFYRKWINPNASQRQLVWVGRVAVIIVALLALSIASQPDSTVLDLVAYAWAGFGAAFGPVVLLSLYWKRFNLSGAISAMITGAATVFVWKQLDGGLFNLYEMIPGWILALTAAWIGTQTTSGKSSESMGNT